MHQILFRPRLRPGPRWGSLQRSPDPLGGLRGPTSKGEGKGRERREGREWKSRGGTGNGENRREGVWMAGKREGRGGEGRKE